MQAFVSLTDRNTWHLKNPQNPFIRSIRDADKRQKRGIGLQEFSN